MTFKIKYKVPNGETKYQMIVSHSSESAKSVWIYTVADIYKFISIEEVI